MDVTRSLVDDIKTKQLQWYGNVQRMEEERLPKEVMKWRPPGRRKRGRPKLTWAEGIRGLMGQRQGRSPAEIVGSNHTGGMDICLL